MKPLVLIFSFLLLAGCNANNGGTTGGNPYSEDTSASGAVAQAIGGSLSNTSSSGLQAFYKANPQRSPVKKYQLDFSIMPKAWASGFCPTFASISASLCSVSGSTMVLDYDYCNYPASAVVFKGKQAFTMSAGTPACGSFPNPGASASLYRQFVSNAAGTNPSVMFLLSAYGTRAAVDHTSANLSNFDNQVISTVLNGGYGMKIDFNGSGIRSAITLKERVVVVNSYDHTIDASLSIAEGASSRSVTGTVKVYLNGARIIGNSTLTSIVHNDTCCLPVSGSITTSFSAGTNVAPTAIGSLFVGKSETLTFTGCGTAELQNYSGSVSQVSLSRCF